MDEPYDSGQLPSGAHGRDIDGPGAGAGQLAAACGGLGAALLVFALMAATDPGLPIVWDEGFTLIRLARVRAWFRAVRDPVGFVLDWNPDRVAPPMQDQVTAPAVHQLDSRAKLFAPRVIAWFWPFAREEPHGHPPFYAWLGLAGDVLTPSRDELARARLGPIILFSATAGAVFAFLARRRGYWAAILGAGAFALSPQLFAMGHYAHY